MDFNKEDINGVSLFKVNIIRATMNEAEEFKFILSEEIGKGKKNLVIDLSDCEYIDSTFLGTLVVTLKKVTTQGGDLRLIGFKPAVRSMFELTRMYRVFETFETKDEAVKSFS
jgi:anti-anti-sigma factor